MRVLFDCNLFRSLPFWHVASVGVRWPAISKILRIKSTPLLMQIKFRKNRDLALSVPQTKYDTRPALTACKIGLKSDVFFIGCIQR